MLAVAMGVAVCALLLVGCSTAPTTNSDRQELHTDAQGALDSMRATDSSLQQFLSSSNAYGYAIVPDIGKGGLGVGGAYGHG